MANALLTSQVLTFEPLMILENELHLVPNFYRDADKEFGKNGNKIGDTLLQRKPSRFGGRDGQAYQPEALTDTQVPIVINQQSGVDFQWGSVERKLSLDDLSDRYLRPAAISIANKLDLRAAATAYQNTANNVGTAGTVPGLGGSDSFYIYSLANQLLTQMGFKRGTKRTNVMTAAMEVGWNTYSKAFFNPTGKLTAEWDSGQISNALGQKMFVDENIPRHTIGALGGTPAVSGANQTGSSVNVSGLSASIANWGLIGDVITFAGVFAVNPQSRQSTGSLQQFVLQANASSDGGGLATLSVSPAIVASGQYQNVTGSPADGALISVFGVAAAGQGALAGVTTPQGLIFTPQAYCFASIRLDKPDGVDTSMETTAPGTGISLRFVRQYIGATDQWINRYDVAYGISPMYTEGGVRVNS